METTKIDFIIKYFGCYTTIDGKEVLTSLANTCFAPVVEFWNMFSGDAEKYFEIRESDDKNKLYLILDSGIRRYVEQGLGLR